MLSFFSKWLIWVLVSFPSLLVPCIFFFISLCIAFISSFCDWIQSFLRASWLPVFWTLHLIGCLSPYHLVLFLEFWSVLSFGSYFFVLAPLLHCKERGLRYLSGRGNPLCCAVRLYVGEGSEGETMPLARLLGSCHSFCHFPLFPQADCAISGVDSQVGGFLYLFEPHGPLQRILLWDYDFLPLLHLTQVFTARGFEALFPKLDPWVAQCF